MGNTDSSHQSDEKSLANNVAVEWTELQPCGFAHQGIEGHCAAAVHGQLFVFGGVCCTVDGQRESNELWNFHPDTRSWKLVEATGDIPSTKAFACMTSVHSNLYVFGGMSVHSGWCNDLHTFDTGSRSWRLVVSNGIGPSPRDKASMTTVREELVYLFGGFGPQGMEREASSTDEDDVDDSDAVQFGWFNDLFVFNPTSSTWFQPKLSPESVLRPSPRAALGLCAVDQLLIVFGGRDSEGRRNDVFVFNTETRKWSNEFNLTGSPPSPRSFHSATIVGCRILVFGGRSVTNQHLDDVHILDLSTRQWLQPKVTGSRPSVRGCHVSVCVKDELMVFGGSADFDAETNACRLSMADMYTCKTEDIIRGGVVPSNDLDSESTQSTPACPQGTCEGAHETI